MATAARLKPKVVLRKVVVNRSSRGGAVPKLIVIHSTESENEPGTDDLASVVNWFNNPKAQASSHVITDADGTSARCVPDDEKAWTQKFYNPVSLAVEQIGKAASGQWRRSEIRETARWCARWSIKYGIPLRKGAVDRRTGKVLRRGIVRHSELQPLGGNHGDPGVLYPMGDMIRLARWYRAQLLKS